jgi:hypothetical protein
MSEIKPLYEDRQLKVTYQMDFDGNVVSVEDHELLIKISEGDYDRHLIQRGGLKELAFTSRDDLEGKLRLINKNIPLALLQFSINPEAVGMALAQAYIEDEKRHKRIQDAEYLGYKTLK